MGDLDLAPVRAFEASSQVSVCLSDGSYIPVRLRLLSYDSCEFEVEHEFAPGEQVNIHIFRMGWIRARVVSAHWPIVEAEFDKEYRV
jgi:hypothetical protein